MNSHNNNVQNPDDLSFITKGIFSLLFGNPLPDEHDFRTSPFDQLTFNQLPNELILMIMNYLVDDHKALVALAQTSSQFKLLFETIINFNIEQFIFLVPFEKAWDWIKRFRETNMFLALKQNFLEDPYNMSDEKIIRLALTTNDITLFSTCCDRLDLAIQNLKADATNEMDKTIAKSLEITSLFIKRTILITEIGKLDNNLSPAQKCETLKQNPIIRNLIQILIAATNKSEIVACTELIQKMYQFPLFINYPFMSKELVADLKAEKYYFTTLAGESLCYFKLIKLASSLEHINLENTILTHTMISDLKLKFNTSILNANTSQTDFHNQVTFNHLNRYLGINGLFALNMQLNKFLQSIAHWRTPERIQFGILFANNFVELWENELRKYQSSGEVTIYSDADITEERLADDFLDEVITMLDSIENESLFTLDEQPKTSWTNIVLSQAQSLLFWNNNNHTENENNNAVAAHTWEGRDVLKEYKQKLISRKSNANN